jgi:hypothetical protein
MHRSSGNTLYIWQRHGYCCFNGRQYRLWQDRENDECSQNWFDSSGKGNSELCYYHLLHNAGYDCYSYHCVVGPWCLRRFLFSPVDISRAAYLRKSHPGWINVPTLIVDCVSVAIAFIPEGLPIALTASLTITANLMRKNKILCKSLKTVETLGSVSVICSDKTGTLTKVCLSHTNRQERLLHIFRTKCMLPNARLVYRTWTLSAPGMR